MKILVIEDDPKVAEVLRQGLAEEMFTVEVAGDGEQGEFLAATNHYDLIILDVLLPRQNGFAICSALRTEKIATPILMLTARDATADKIEGLNRGADDYLTKPFAFEELLARVRALLRRGPTLVESMLECGHLSVDTTGHIVTVHGRQVELTAREYALLVCLMRSEGKVLSRQQLADQVWGADYDPFSNVIDVYINYLRNKVDTDRQRKLIHTVRGLGYIFKSKPRHQAKRG
jgi:DNA-binding response OmpR family regulator